MLQAVCFISPPRKVTLKRICACGYKKERKNNRYWWLEVGPRSPVNKIKAQDKRNNRILQLVAVSHPECQLMVKHKKIPTVLDFKTLLCNNINQGHDFFGTQLSFTNVGKLFYFTASYIPDHIPE